MAAVKLWWARLLAAVGRPESPPDPPVRLTPVALLDAALLKAAMPHATTERCGLYAPHLEAARVAHGIEWGLETAHWIGQVAAESGSLATVKENLNYSASALRRVFPSHFAPGEEHGFARKPERIANRVYANRNGNGPELSGDGWKHRGFGLIQCTGHDNQLAWAKDADSRGLLAEHGETVASVMARPEVIAENPAFAADSAGWFWRVNGCGEHARRDDVVSVSGIVNRGNAGPTREAERARWIRGINGLNDRIQRTREAKRGLGLL